MIYQIGQLLRQIAQFTDINGNPADPTTITLLVQDPTGADQTYNYPADIVRDGTGLYHYDLLVGIAGQWFIQWNAGGVLVDQQQSSLTVAESIFNQPLEPPIDLCSVDDVRYWLGLGQSAPGTPDLKIERLITSASRFILSQTLRTSFLAPVSYTEQRNGNGFNIMTTYNWPILSVSSVSYNGITIPPSVNQVSGWVNDQNRIMLINYLFVPGFQNITLTYTAGYNSLPLDVNQACIELVAQKFARQTHVDQDSKHLGNETITFSRLDIPAEVQRVIDKYRVLAIIE